MTDVDRLTVARIKMDSVGMTEHRVSEGSNLDTSCNYAQYMENNIVKGAARLATASLDIDEVLLVTGGAIGTTTAQTKARVPNVGVTLIARKKELLFPVDKRQMAALAAAASPAANALEGAIGAITLVPEVTNAVNDPHTPDLNGGDSALASGGPSAGGGDERAEKAVITGMPTGEPTVEPTGEPTGEPAAPFDAADDQIEGLKAQKRVLFAKITRIHAPQNNPLYPTTEGIVSRRLSL